MFRSVRARLIIGLVLGTLWLSAAAAPTAALTRTRWVDNDNHPGDGPRACNHAGFSSIQDAIDASSPGDTVNVCPGNYQEQLTIDVPGLTVRSVPALGARIWAPAVLDDSLGPTSLVHISARDVEFDSFWLKFNDGDVVPFVKGIDTNCVMASAAIWADAPHATIKANQIKTVGDNTLSGSCGYLFGIVLADAGAFTSGGAWGADSSLVWRNRVRDFKEGGILVGGDRSVRVLYNNVRYVHYNDPATCELVPVIGVNPSLDFPCGLPDVLPTVSPFDGLFPYNFGIAVEGALANVRGNSVYSTLDTSIINFPQLSFLAAGIVMAGATDGSRVVANRMDNVFIGFAASDDTDFFPLPGVKFPTAPNGLAVSGNRTSETLVGFVIDAADGYYYANRAHLGFFGVMVDTPAAGNTFDHNDFRYNEEVDCLDQTTGGGTLGTANSWIDPNLGFSDQPDGICLAFFPGTV